MNKHKNKMHILEHLEELRWTIIKIIICLIPGVIIAFLGLDYLQNLIISTVPKGVELRFQSPADSLLIQLKMALYAGIIFAFPAIFYFMWNFISPGLRKKEKKIIVFITSTGTLLFLMGIFLAYKALPFIVQTLVSYGAKSVLNIWDYSKYINFIITMILAFGIIFEIPLIVMALVKLKIISVKTLKKQRGYALIIGAFLAAILTPPDPYSMILLLIPLMLLFEIGIIGAIIIEKRMQKNEILQCKIDKNENEILASIKLKKQKNKIKNNTDKKITDEDIDFFDNHDFDTNYNDFCESENYYYDIPTPKSLKTGKMELDKLPDLFGKSFFTENKNNSKKLFED